MSRKLHIGGKIKKEGWEILNALPNPDVDHVCNANDLSKFDDNTFTEIYASHTLHAEHNQLGWSEFSTEEYTILTTI